MKTYYNEIKEEARNKAIDWQSNFDNETYSWQDLAFWSDHFAKVAKRYGLILEFRDNGII